MRWRRFYLLISFRLSFLIFMLRHCVFICLKYIPTLSLDVFYHIRARYYLQVLHNLRFIISHLNISNFLPFLWDELLLMRLTQNVVYPQSKSLHGDGLIFCRFSPFIIFINYISHFQIIKPKVIDIYLIKKLNGI